MHQKQTTTNQKFQNEWETFTTFENIIFGLNKDNFAQSSNFIISKFCKKYPMSYDIILTRMIYTSLLIDSNNFDIYLRLLQEIEKYEENNKINTKIINTFSQFLLKKKTQESFYFLNYMIEYNLLETKFIQNIREPFFAHINEDISDEDDLVLHKQLIKEGHNPNEIAKIILNDEVEKLQEISTQTNFDFNQIIRKSIYERCSFINQFRITLIDYAAFFSSVKCFKYLLMNGAKVKNAGKYAVAGGNEEIIHLCEQNHSTFDNACEAAIKFHRNDVFKYIYENKLEKIKKLEELGVICVSYFNYEIFAYLENEGMKINENIINEAAKIGNIFLVKYFLKNNQLPENILVFASFSGNIELVTYILNQKGFYVNAKDISKFYIILILII